jgi:calcium homeostasis ER protein
MRKGAEDLQIVLEAMVIPMFCHAKVKEAGNEENLTKLNKLLTLWENKNQYVSSIAVDKLRDASNTWLEYHSELLKRHAVVVTQIAQNIQKTYEGYQSQHQMFCQHVSQNIKVSTRLSIKR